MILKKLLLEEGLKETSDLSPEMIKMLDLLVDKLKEKGPEELKNTIRNMEEEYINIIKNSDFDLEPQ